ncbi:MAG: lysophospholipid acyltransferase family protein [Thermoanaerobaculia bacterium]
MNVAAWAGPASTAVSWTLRGILATGSLEPVHEERFRDLSRTGEPFVFALWHGRMLLPIWRHRGQGVATMASKSKDGEVIARWLEDNGYFAVRGSTNKGGARGIVVLKRYLEAGHPAALTVDGPKGPPRVVQEGIVTLARRSRAWVLPVSSGTTRPRFLKSWDRYLVPKAFSRSFVTYGEPFRLESKSDEEALGKIKRSIDEATEEADRLAGINPPEPWGSSSRQLRADKERS